MSLPSDWCFPASAVRFLKDLKDNNNRDWFAQNKSIYEQVIKRPAQAYCELMCAQLNSLTGLPHQSKIFRVHRDVRFSKDKTPYNAHLHISFLLEGRSGASPAWFFALEPEKLTFGVGAFGFDKPTLERFRQQIVDGQGEPLTQHLTNLEKQGIRLSEPALKRVPRGFDPEPGYSQLLRHKGLTAWRDIETTKPATRPGLIKQSREEYRALLPLFSWLGGL
ncbi:MAG: DUF2461 domain-containing protein [Alphaproteobacteria bacterium]|nr:DUF2461 domain-containing protein [Alphaproteobacteria bacterium]